MISFLLAYEIDPLQAEAIERYSSGWIHLVEAHGGMHHGFHVARDVPEEMIAFFAFPSRAKYDEFRKAALHNRSANELWALASATGSVRFRDRQVFQSISDGRCNQVLKRGENELRIV